LSARRHRRRAPLGALGWPQSVLRGRRLCRLAHTRPHAATLPHARRASLCRRRRRQTIMATVTCSAPSPSPFWSPSPQRRARNDGPAKRGQQRIIAGMPACPGSLTRPASKQDAAEPCLVPSPPSTCSPAPPNGRHGQVLLHASHSIPNTNTSPVSSASSPRQAAQSNVAWGVCLSKRPPHFCAPETS
jgi:hypothetical protein